MPPRVAISQAKWVPTWTLLLWGVGLLAITTTGPPDGDVFAGRSLYWTAFYMGPLPLSLFYQAAFIFRYPGLAARHNMQPPNRYGSASYGIEEAPKYAAGSFLVGLFFVLATLITFGT